MEKKIKVADFAELVGCTPKTVYKMIERGELITGSERVNNRETTVIITSDAQIEDLQIQLGKLPVNVGECNETVTVNEGNEPVKNSNDNVYDSVIVDKVIDLSREYINRLTTVNEELVNYKSQVLLLEDKQKTEKEALEHWQNEYFQQKTELEQLKNTNEKEMKNKNKEISDLMKDNSDLMKGKYRVTIWLITVIVLLMFGLITVSLLLFFEKGKSNNNNNLTGKDTVIEQQLPVTTKTPAPVAKNQATKKARYNK